MDDLNRKLSEILNDPDSMEKVREMAQNLFSEESESQTEGEMQTVSEIMGIINKFKAAGEDDRTALIKALKPHLSDRKKEKADKAVKLLKIIEILPALKESGFLDF